MFHDRRQAGILLAQKLIKFKRALLLAIPRGGVEVALPLSLKLNIPLDTIVIKKIPFPGDEELAIGAAGRDDYVLNDLAQNIPASTLQRLIKEKQFQAQERYNYLRHNLPAYNVKGKRIILVDDGAATGSTMLAAIKILKKAGAKRILVALPVASLEAYNILRQEAEVVCLEVQKNLHALSQFYESFPQLTDETVKEMLQK